MGIVLWFGSPLVVRLLGHEPVSRRRSWIVASIAAVAVSWFLPSPWFAEHTATFSQHAVGGGSASALMTYYFLSHVGLGTFGRRALAVFAVTSVLGVLNELFELGLDEWRGTRLTADAAWDLLANTIGAAISFLVIELVLVAIGANRASQVR